MRPILKFEENGRIFTAQLIVMAKPLILCCQSTAIPPLREGSSNVQLAQMVFRSVLPSTKAVQT